MMPDNTICSAEIRIKDKQGKAGLKMGFSPISRTKIFDNYKSNLPCFADDRE